MNKYFWKNGKVCSYSPLQIKQGYADDLTELTEQELEQHLYPPISTEQLAEQIRAERDSLIQDLRWRVERHQDEVKLDITPTEELQPLLEYIQALRDIPQQEGFPYTVVFPQEP